MVRYSQFIVPRSSHITAPENKIEVGELREVFEIFEIRKQSRRVPFVSKIKKASNLITVTILYHFL